MGTIHKLPPALADMIAAGEVVERPASVVKELVENAVDAGAAQILVEIQNGGITLIRVTDNGSGMSPEDAPAAFLRHATSKIASPEDLSGISTMGFRGEALAAISAVSKIDLLTATEEAEHGVAVRVEAGTVLDVSPAGCPTGTTMVVRELFYNTPARMKFLKRDSVEGSHVSGAVQRQALSHPEIAFRFIRDGRQELSTPGDGRLLSAVYAALGRQYAKDMTEVTGESGGVRVTGYVGKPTANRGTRSYQYFFVNGRCVKSGLLTRALEDAYKNQMMTGRFPICVLHVALSPSAVDVNVHPAKTEVKFLREGDVFDAVHYAVLGALSRTPDRPEASFSRQRTPGSGTPHMSVRTYRGETGASLSAEDRASAGKFMETLSRRAERPGRGSLPLHDSVTSGVRTVVNVPGEPPEEQEPSASGADAAPEGMAQTGLELPAAPRPVPPAPQPEIQGKKSRPADYRIIGQAMDTYIIVEQGDDLLFIDKHAAHERVLFEKFRAQPAEIMSQLLLRPLQTNLSREETAILLEKAETLEKLGFSIEDFGGGALLVRAIPSDIDERDAEACLGQLAERLLEGVRPDPAAVRDELLHTIACKAAVKGGRKTDPMELSALVAEVLGREDIKHCPHGRPVCVTVTRGSLERQFKRS